MNWYYERPATLCKTVPTMNPLSLINRFIHQFLIATIFLSAPLLLAGSETSQDPKDGAAWIGPVPHAVKLLRCYLVF
jgi:hypothetical protein